MKQDEKEISQISQLNCLDNEAVIKDTANKKAMLPFFHKGGLLWKKNTTGS